MKVLILSCLLLVLYANASTQVAYHNFNSNDGLPSNEVYCVHQDHQGFLWFGTDHGIVKYNGYSFKTFTTADGLTDNTVLSMKEDDSGNIWFLTLTGGMCYFDGTKFAPHPFNDTIKKLCNRRIPTSFEILPDKEIWMGFIDFGVAKIGIHKAELFDMIGPVSNSDTLYNYVWHLTKTRYVYYSFKNRKPLSTVHTPAKSIENYNFTTKYLPLGGINFNLLLLKDKGALMDRSSHLIYLDSAKSASEFEWPKNNEIVNLCQTNDHKTWIFPKNRPCYSIELNHTRLSLVDSFSFVHNASSLLLDQQGNYWITTVDQGIYMVPNDKIRKYIVNGQPESPKLSYLTSNSNYLFVSLPEGKLLRINNQFNATVDTRISKGPSTISGILFDPLNNPRVTNLDPVFEHLALLNGYPTKIVELDKDKMLLGMISGLAILDKNKMVYNSRTDGFTQRITEICPLSAQKYLIGTLTGLYYFTLTDSPRIAKELYLKDVRITAAKMQNTGNYGIATRGKGVFINIKNKFYTIGEQQGLVSDLAEDLYFENDSILWVASFKGISKVYFHISKDSLTTRIKNYTREDGLCSNQVNGITGFNGFIWLATNEGLCYFRPRDLAEDTIQIPLFLGNISVNGQPHTGNSIVLSHDENNVYIEFNALYYKAIQGIRYKMRLNGTRPWKYTDLNYVQYHSLPAGKYQFEVAAEDKDGKYRSDIHVLKFTIRPRFTDTIAFKIILGLTLLLITGVIISSIFSYQKLKATNVIKLLQSEFKALSYQINPHFIFNVLNSIQYYIIKKDTENALHLLSSFSLLIRRIINNSREQYIGIIEEVECLREYLDLEKMRLDGKFEYTINISSNINIEDKNILPMIIQPLVENSIWHGIVPSSKAGVIKIDFNKENGAVICIVDDNGVGINATVERKEKNPNNLSMAMENVRERLKIIGELNESNWAIKTEDKSVSDPTQSGTVVTIVFPSIKSKS